MQTSCAPLFTDASCDFGTLLDPGGDLGGEGVEDGGAAGMGAGSGVRAARACKGQLEPEEGGQWTMHKADEAGEVGTRSSRSLVGSEHANLSQMHGCGLCVSSLQGPQQLGKQQQRPLSVLQQHDTQQGMQAGLLPFRDADDFLVSPLPLTGHSGERKESEKGEGKHTNAHIPLC